MCAFSYHAVPVRQAKSPVKWPKVARKSALNRCNDVGLWHDMTGAEMVTAAVLEPCSVPLQFLTKDVWASKASALASACRAHAWSPPA